MTPIDKEEQQQVILLDTQPFSAHQSHCQDLDRPPLKTEFLGLYNVIQSLSATVVFELIYLVHF